MDKVELFKPLEKYEKLKLIDGLKVVEFQAGEFIIHEGDKGDHFYIIEKGDIQCGKENESGEFTLVRTLESGNHFGEVALINNVRRTMSVRSVGTAQLLCLTRSTFNRILGSIKKYLHGSYEGQEVHESSFTSLHSDHSDIKGDKNLHNIEEAQDEDDHANRKNGKQ